MYGVGLADKNNRSLLLLCIEFVLSSSFLQWITILKVNNIQAIPELEDILHPTHQM